jgi:hypothetical protein
MNKIIFFKKIFIKACIKRAFAKIIKKNVIILFSKKLQIEQYLKKIISRMYFYLISIQIKEKKHKGLKKIKKS